MKRSFVLPIFLLVYVVCPVLAGEVSLESYLGNHAFLDRDAYSFSGYAGENVEVKVETLERCSPRGSELTLALRDRISGTWFAHVETGASSLSYSGVLPETGEYIVVVKQTLRTPKSDRYHGHYRVSVYTSAHGVELNPARNVESIVEGEACHAEVKTELGDPTSTDVDSYRFFGHSGQTLNMTVLHEGACPSTGNDLEVAIRAIDTPRRRGSMGRRAEEWRRQLFYGFPEGSFSVTLPARGNYELTIRQPTDIDPGDRYSGLYNLTVGSNQALIELEPQSDAESTYDGVTYLYRDQDGDGFGGGADLICVLSGETPPDGYVDNHLDCDDGDARRHLLCELEAYTLCLSPYSLQCTRAAYGVQNLLDELNGQDINKDKFAWGGWERPGSWSGGNKRHLQSIQYFDNEGLNGGAAEPERFLVISMSDEHNHRSNIVIVKVEHFGTESGADDHVVQQSSMFEINGEYHYNHPGGAQLVGEYLFVALEDFLSFSRPQIGVWKIHRGTSPTLEFKYLIDIYATHPTYKEHPEWLTDPDHEPDYHSSTVGVVRLKDRTYLLATCVESGCDKIIFMKSAKPDLEGDPGFHVVDEWHRGELYPGGDNFSDCPPQNMNLVADRIDGSIYMVMFGSEGVYRCGGALNDDQVFGYRLHFTESAEMQLEFTNKENVSTGDSCDLGIGVTGTNFDAGSGLWICPGGENRLSVLATEHYNSCGSGKSRWGVSENWR